MRQSSASELTNPAKNVQIPQKPSSPELAFLLGVMTWMPALSHASYCSATTPLAVQSMMTRFGMYGERMCEVKPSGEYSLDLFSKVSSQVLRSMPVSSVIIWRLLAMPSTRKSMLYSSSSLLLMSLSCASSVLPTSPGPTMPTASGVSPTSPG